MIGVVVTTLTATSNPTVVPTTIPTSLPYARTWEQASELAKSAVAKLSLSDKVKMVSGIGWEGGPCVGNILSVPVPGFDGLCLQDAPTGVRFANGVSAFPASINLAATFDRDFMLKHGELMGQEFKGKGVNIALTPMMNMMRTPNAGRNWEGQGADPYLAAVSASLQVIGVQSQGVIATAKHFIGNEQEYNRQEHSANIDDQTLHEFYLKPFRACIDAGVASMMCAYNKLNGTLSCENSNSNNKILKERLGFKGFVMTDWWATQDTVTSATGGSDMMMPGTVNFNDKTFVWSQKLIDAVNTKKVDESRVTDMAIRILSAWYLVGQDKGFPKVSLKDGNVNVQKDHANHIRAVGAASSILLKNTNDVLPLKNNLKIAVVGTDAGPGKSTQNDFSNCNDRACSDGTIAQGWGSGTTYFPYIITPVDGIKSRAATTGSTVTSVLSDKDMNSIKAVTQSADVAIVFVSANSGETYLDVPGYTDKGDRISLALWNGGDELIKQVASTNKKTIVVIHGPGAVDMEWIDNPNIVGVIHALFPGQESGNAIADILFGIVNPSGRLPFTINKPFVPYSAWTTKDMTIPYTEGILVDYRYNDVKNIQPLFEFGYGLSYTTFTYQQFNLVQTKDKVTVTFNISNIGKYDGHEVAQLYLGFPINTNQPPKQLKDFTRKFIKVGTSMLVSLEITPKEMDLWDVQLQKYYVPKGEYTIHIGSSSRKIHWKGVFNY
ncbi:hypothetical protein HDV02_005054 [Globomyces sp. JEL0801]|nr:hypothetical protein HDV02_005054 [Globomyces sp. JEL0801]